MLEVEVCEGGQAAREVCELICDMARKFFSLGVDAVESVCNSRRNFLLAQWRQEDPQNGMSLYGLPNITYQTAITEASPPFALLLPGKIYICVWSTRVSTGNQGLAAIELERIDKEGRITRLHVFLSMLDRAGNRYHWKGFCMPIEDMLVHELLHACGDTPWRGRQDGVIRHNIIGIEALKPLLERL